MYNALHSKNEEIPKFKISLKHGTIILNFP